MEGVAWGHRVEGKWGGGGLAARGMMQPAPGSSGRRWRCVVSTETGESRVRAVGHGGVAAGRA
jgi:hypothetical protein